MPRLELRGGTWVELNGNGDAWVATIADGVEIVIPVLASDFDLVAAFFRAHSPAASARNKAAERVRRYRALQKRNGNANGNAKVTQPSEEHRALAAKLGLDCDLEWAKYRDWQANVPAAKRHRNLTAGFNNWLRKAQEFKPKRDKHEAVSVAIWGDKAPSRQRLKTINEMFSDPPAVEGSYERLS